MNNDNNVYTEFIGVILNKEEALSLALLELTENHFLDLSCREIFKTIIEFKEAGKKITYNTLTYYFMDAKKDRLVLLLMDIQKNWLTSELFQIQLQEIKNKYIKEQLHKILIRQSQFLEKNIADIDIDTFQLDLQQELVNLFLQKDSGNKIYSMKEVMSGCIDRQRNYNQDNYLWFGFKALDSMFNGIEMGGLVVVGALQSTGKSAFGMAIAKKIAEEKHPVLLFSAEMGIWQYGNRFIANEGRLILENIRDNQLGNIDIEKFYNACDYLSQLPIYIIDKSILTPTDIQNYLQLLELQLNKKIKCIVIDHLQIMRFKGKKNRYEEVSEITARLKQIAKEHETVIIVLSQLNRQVTTRSNKEPVMSDLRDSGQIEADADIVMLLSRKDYQNEDSTKIENTLDIYIRKHRDGKTGKTIMFFDKKNMVIADLESYLY